MSPTKALACIALVLALTTAIPVEQSSEMSVAQAEIQTLLQLGNDESGCTDVANSLKDEITSEVATSNKLLAALSDGSSCPSEGQDGVTSAQDAIAVATKAASAADAAALAAANADVNFGTIPLGRLEAGLCQSFFEDPGYLSAVQAKASTANAKIVAAAEAKAAHSALTRAQEAATAAVKACQCQTKAAHDAAWQAANENNDKDKESWRKAHNMLCVVQAVSDCQVPDVPTASDATMSQGVLDVQDCPDYA